MKYHYNLNLFEGKPVKQKFGPFPKIVLSKNPINQNHINQEQSVLFDNWKLSFISMYVVLLNEGLEVWHNSK